MMKIGTGKFNFKTAFIMGLLNLLIITGFAEPAHKLFDPLYFHSGIQLQSVVRQSTSNPCWNVRDDSTSTVRYSLQSGSTNGDFRRILDPGQINDSYWTASGSQRLGERSLFYGSFSYRFQNAADKMWSHNRQPYSGLLFVFADSSTGDWELNGLMWNVDISWEFIRDRVYGGISAFYNVDEEYQDIFPRPKGNHRDMFINTGIGAVSSTDSRLGFMLKYYNIQESLKTSKYSLDQEKTPIFYKLRGLDTPLIFRGQTSEERLFSIDGLALSIDGTVRNFIVSKIDFAANYGSSVADNVDGGAYPIEQGSWEDEYASYAVELTISPTRKTDIILYSGGLQRFQTAMHPDLQLEIYNETERRLNGGVIVNLGSGSGWLLSPSVGMTSQMLKREDTFNGILDYFPGTLWKYYLLIDTPDRGYIDFKLGLGLDVYTAGEAEVFIPNNVGFYYRSVTAIDELYYGLDYTAFRFAEALSFGQKRRYSVELEYLRLIPGNSQFFNYTFRDQLQLNFIVEDLVRFTK
ncbi:hypothetical protein KJ762_02315 [bacterium]|nr:hypothetical protein [bacterium]